eukprot:jgi/Chlat1/6030/Chrsp4S06208
MMLAASWASTKGAAGALCAVALSTLSLQRPCNGLRGLSSGVRRRPHSVTRQPPAQLRPRAQVLNTAVPDELDEGVSVSTGRLVQWYPGHIARAERLLKEQLRSVDVVLDVRDARIPLATSYPALKEWANGKKCILVLNRDDMVSSQDRRAWADYFKQSRQGVIFTDGRSGKGINELTKAALSVSVGINEKRRKKGLLPRPMRAAVVGYPNVGKSALINRMLKRKLCKSEPKPGVTRHLRWLRIGGDLDLLDAPGVLPMRIDDQEAATLLAICNDIGEAAYLASSVAAVLVERLLRLPQGNGQSMGAVLEGRYGVSAKFRTGEDYVYSLAEAKYQGDINQAGERLLNDFRRGSLGWRALQQPPARAGNDYYDVDLDRIEFDDDFNRT